MHNGENSGVRRCATVIHQFVKNGPTPPILPMLRALPVPNVAVRTVRFMLKTVI